MTRPGTNNTRQRVVYWAPLTTSTSTGQKRVSSAKLELKVRWVEAKADALSAEGETIRLDAQVKTLQDVAIGGIMWLGKLSALPATPTNLYEIVTYDKVPDLKNKGQDRWAGLQRYSNTLPPTG